MRKYRKILLIIMLMVGLSACNVLVQESIQAVATAPPTALATPTMTATIPPSPTSTPTLTPTPLPGTTKIDASNVDQVKLLESYTVLSEFAVLAFNQKATYLIDVLKEVGPAAKNLETGEMIALEDHTFSPETFSLSKQDFIPDAFIPSRDGAMLASVSSNDEKIQIWNLDTFEMVQELDFSGFSHRRNSSYTWIAGDFSPDLNYFAVSSRVEDYYYLTSEMVIYDLTNGEIVQELEVHHAYTNNVYFDKHGEFIYFIGRGTGTPWIDLLVWDVAQAKVHQAIDAPGHNGFSSGDLNPSETKLAVTFSDPFSEQGSNLGFIDLETWDFSRMKVKRDDISISPVVVDYCNAASILVTVHSYGGQFSLRNVEDGLVLRTVGAEGGIRSIQFSPDCRLIYILTERHTLLVFGI